MLLTFFKQFGLKLSDLWGRNPGGDDGKQVQRDKKPPELDKLWANFNDRLRGLFGKKGGGGAPNPATKGAGIAAVFMVLVSVAVWLISGIYIVGDGQVGLVMTLGKHTDTRQPGVNWRWPFPIQKIELVDMAQTRKIEVGFRAKDKNRQPKESQMVTSDLNIIDIQASVQYRVKSATDWVFNNSKKEEVIRQVAESALREAIGKIKLENVRENRDRIEREVTLIVQTVLDRYALGVQLGGVSVQTIQVPEQLQAGFDEVEKMNLEGKRLEGEAKAYADDVIPKAKAVATRLTQEAEAYRSRVVANAEGDATRFKLVLAEYQKAPVVTRDRMYIETMQHIYTNASKLMVDTKGGSNMLYLPLDKLMGQAAASETKKPMAGSAPAIGAVPEAAPATPAKGASTPAAAPASTGASSVPSARGRETREREVR